MKNASAARVERSHARFSHGEDLGIEFRNEIDAWAKMEATFRLQIRLLREKSALATSAKKSRIDLNSLVYSMRERID